MLEGDEPEIYALTTDSEGENPDVYWDYDPNMAFCGTADIAMGTASWRFDAHLDGPGDL